MIWGLIIAALTLAVDLITDYRLWLKNIPVKHRRGALLRVIFLSPAIWLAGWQYSLLILSTYWVLFDSAFNVLRGFPVLFTGSNDKDDAASDNLLQKLKPWQHVALKVGLIGVGVALILLL